MYVSGSKSDVKLPSSRMELETNEDNGQNIAVVKENLPRVDISPLSKFFFFIHDTYIISHK